jgi:hypothetical protein
MDAGVVDMMWPSTLRSSSWFTFIADTPVCAAVQVARSQPVGGNSAIQLVVYDENHDCVRPPRFHPILLPTGAGPTCVVYQPHLTVLVRFWLPASCFHLSTSICSWAGCCCRNLLWSRICGQLPSGWPQWNPLPSCQSLSPKPSPKPSPSPPVARSPSFDLAEQDCTAIPLRQALRTPPGLFHGAHHHKTLAALPANVSVHAP